MPSPRGIFRLKQVYEEQLSGNWSVKPDVWLSPSPYYASWDFGYFGGGNFTGLRGDVDRIDYSNDTATALSRSGINARQFLAATGNSSFGYFGGGDTGAVNLSTVDRVNYSNDTGGTSPR